MFNNDEKAKVNAALNAGGERTAEQLAAIKQSIIDRLGLEPIEQAAKAEK